MKSYVLQLVNINPFCVIYVRARYFAFHCFQEYKMVLQVTDYQAGVSMVKSILKQNKITILHLSLNVNKINHWIQKPIFINKYNLYSFFVINNIQIT
jgi:hypothetical protein